MVKAVLVNIDVDQGTRVLNILDHAKLDVKVALWVVLPEYEDWRLVLASRRFDAAGVRGGYTLVGDALRAAGLPIALTPTFMILRMDDPFIRGLRKIFTRTKSIEGMRLGLQTIGDRFIEHAYVYRVS